MIRIQNTPNQRIAYAFILRGFLIDKDPKHWLKVLLILKSLGGFLIDKDPKQERYKYIRDFSLRGFLIDKDPKLEQLSDKGFIALRVLFFDSQEYRERA